VLLDDGSNRGVNEEVKREEEEELHVLVLALVDRAETCSLTKQLNMIAAAAISEGMAVAPRLRLRLRLRLRRRRTVVPM